MIQRASESTARTDTWERFPNAPITEALLDVRVRLPSAVGLDELATLHERIRDAYPQMRERQQFQGEIRFQKGRTPTVGEPRGGTDGFLFTSADGRRIVQARLDGFTFNWLQPYDKWTSFRDMARELWSQYRELAQPASVTRLALRYINRIRLPLPIKDFRDYILTVPEIAPGLPQRPAGFFARIVLPFQDHECLAIVTETIEPSERDALPWILDIDAYTERPFTAESNEIWLTFEKLRDAKNEVFFRSLTEKAKELFR